MNFPWHLSLIFCVCFLFKSNQKLSQQDIKRVFNHLFLLIPLEPKKRYGGKIKMQRTKFQKEKKV